MGAENYHHADVDPKEVLHFWFEETNSKQRFAKNPAFDAEIRRRFLVTHQQASSCELWQWRKTAEGCLAEIIVLDQFSRNLFRDTPESFAFDALALALAQSAVATGVDHQMPPEQRTFFYMPHMHSESASVHAEALRLFTELGIESQLGFEVRHKAIIDEFGRYPHRNAILNRPSTAAEVAFLQRPGSSF